MFSSRRPGAELQASDRTPGLEGRLEPGKEEPVQALILDTHKQPLITDKYGLQLHSEALSLAAHSAAQGFFTRHNPTDGGLFLAEALSSQP